MSKRRSMFARCGPGYVSNAELLAAAPDMLALLRQVTARLRLAYDANNRDLADDILDAEALLERLGE